MIYKVPSMLLTAFLVTALLPFGSGWLSFAQSDRQSSDPASKAEELFQEALHLADINSPESPRPRLQEAMRLCAQMGKPEKAAQAALQIADRYKQKNRYEEALYCYKQALGVTSLTGSPRLNVLNTVALIYARLYQVDLALPYLTEALNQAQAIKDLSAQVMALTGLAELYLKKGDKAQATDSIKKAQKLNEQRNAGTDPALLYLIGQIRQEEGAVEAAKGTFEEALAIYRKQGNVEGQVKTLCAISAISLLNSQKQVALEQATQAAELADKHHKQMVSAEDKVNARELLWRAMLSRARAERAVGQKDKASKSYEFAISHFEVVWMGRYTITETGALNSREEIQAAYRELVDLFVEQGKVKEAYEYVGQAKSRAIPSMIVAQQSTLPSESRKRLAEIARARLLIDYNRKESLPLDLSLEQQAQLPKDISDEERKLLEEHLQIEINRFRQNFVWTTRTTAEQLQKLLAVNQAALVEFFLGENRSFAWLFTHGTVFFETLPARSEIEKAVRSYLETLAAAPNPLRLEKDLLKLRGQGKELFSTLFRSFSGHVNPGQRLIVVPDGLLNYLPFGALIHNERYLIEDHDISYDPSASMLDLLQNSKSRVDREDSMEILAVGDPVFDPTLKAADARKAKSDVTRQMRARGFSLPPLPRTRDEVQFITNLFPADRRKLLTGMASTEEAIKHESLRRYRRLHFATHSLIDENAPLRSAVALTPDNNAEEDGLLEVSEISKLNLDCDLVVVSACQTGRGQLLTGEGIVGLSWAFFRAGARSVVVSLWNVSDASTSQLMKSFYQNMTGGLSNAAALRAAKLQMLNSGKVTRHPYYWSAFIITGKP